MRHFGGVTVSVVSLAIFLGLLAVVTGRVLGPADRGIVVVFMTLASMLMVITSCGANTYARVALVAQTKPIDLADYFGLSALLIAVVSFLAATAGLGVLSLTSSLPNAWVPVLLVVYSALSLASYMLRDGLYAFGHNLTASRGDPLAAATQLLLLIVVWQALGLTLRLALVSITVGQSTAVVYLLLGYRRYRLLCRPTWHRPKLVRQVLHGFPALVTNLGQSFVFRLDRIILGALVTTSAVGIYSVAATLTEVLLLIPTSVGQVIFHRIASGAIELRAVRALRLANLAVSSALAILLAFLAPWLVDLLFGKHFDSATTPLRILLIGAVAMGAYLVDIACTNAQGNLARASTFTLLGLTVVTALDFILIPKWQASGAAWASTIGYVTMAIATAISVRSRRRHQPAHRAMHP